MPAARYSGRSRYRRQSIGTAQRRAKRAAQRSRERPVNQTRMTAMGQLPWTSSRWVLVRRIGDQLHQRALPTPLGAALTAAECHHPSIETSFLVSPGAPYSAASAIRAAGSIVFAFWAGAPGRRLCSCIEAEVEETNALPGRGADGLRHGVEIPLARNALEPVCAALGEGETGARHEVSSPCSRRAPRRAGPAPSPVRRCGRRSRPASRRRARIRRCGHRRAPRDPARGPLRRCAVRSAPRARGRRSWRRSHRPWCPVPRRGSGAARRERARGGGGAAPASRGRRGLRHVRSNGRCR